MSTKVIDAYNDLLSNNGDSDTLYLYLNFEQMDSAKDCCSNLINGYWQNADFDVSDYGKLPQSIDWFDVLRKALLIAMNQIKKEQKSKNIIFVIDSLDDLIFSDDDFKYWLMFFGAAISQ